MWLPLLALSDDLRSSWSLFLKILLLHWERNLNFQLSLYNPLCFNHFIFDILRVSYLIKDESKTVDPNLMTHVIINYLFVNYLMTRKPWVELESMNKQLMSYQTFWPSNEAALISGHFVFCSQYISENYGVVTHQNSLDPTINL